MTAHVTTIKTQIGTYLGQLVTAGTLGGYTVTDFAKNPLDDNTAGFPHAFLMPPGTDSEAEDNRTNMRTYTFNILILMKGENMAANAFEELLQALLDKFDNNPTLAGTSDGAMLPATSVPEPVRYGDKEFLAFTLTLKPRKLETLTF